jgi:hypothetical protein
MGQPIKLTKGRETMTVYGRAQAAVHVAEGWRLEDADMAASLPAVETAVNLADLDIDELKALADEKGVTYTWNIKPETLRQRLGGA